MDTTPPPDHPNVSLRGDVLWPQDITPPLIAAWQALATAAAEPNSFMEAWCALPSLKYLRNDNPVRFIAAWRGDALIGIIAVGTCARYGRIPVPHIINWQSVQCFYGAPLIRRGCEAEFWGIVLDILDGAQWAPGFLRIMAIEQDGATHRGLASAAASRDRPCPVVHRMTRALLQSDLDPDAYLDAALRSKKRKELRRLSNRLAELGSVTRRSLNKQDDLGEWIADFLALESAGWKGSDGAAFANAANSELFFREIMVGARAAGALEILRLDLDGRAIAMLINFVRPPGSFSFKIAYDEALARFSPGVMIEIDNLKQILTDPRLEWMDSCAQEDHPMINGLWMERRTLVQVAVPLKGTQRRAIFAICRLLEKAAAQLRAYKAGWARA